MKKFFSLTLLLAAFCLSGTAQLTLNDFTDAEIYFDGIFSEECAMDDYGNVILNMGSASSGRCGFRISDVKITMEEKPEEPGCADICPPRVLIHFECKKSECVYDPVSPTGFYQTGVIEFLDVKKGKKAYEYLLAFQKLMSDC